MFLKEVGTKVEVTVTPRTAFYRFTYTGAGSAKLLVDTQWMMTSEDNLRTCVLASKTEPDLAAKTLLGSRATKGWVTRILEGTSVLIPPSSTCDLFATDSLLFETRFKG